MLRRGFALLEITIAVAILAIGAAVLLPVMARVDSRARAAEARDELEVWFLALDRFSFRVARYPARLSQLVIPIVSGDPTNCTNGNTTFGGTSTNWASTNGMYGPFYRRRLVRVNNSVAFVLANGFGSVADDVTRLPGRLFVIAITEVIEADAIELDVLVDAGDGSATGVVQWTAAVEGVVTVSYQRVSATSLSSGACGT